MPLCTRHHTFIAIEVMILNTQVYHYFSSVECSISLYVLRPSPPFGLQILIFLLRNTGVSTVSTPVDPRTTVFVYASTSSLSSSTPSPHRCLHLRCSLRLIAVFIYAVAFASSLSSSTLSPSPHRRLHLRCRLRLIAVFIYAVAFASSLAIFIYAFTSAFASSLSSSHCRLRSIYPKIHGLVTRKRGQKKGAAQQTAHGVGRRPPWNVALGLGAVLPHGLYHGGNSRQCT
ncbi:hypothetical protein OUZ56_001269 [Daphnia magna]|uniref:Uncharacterized protein n=1 Tax=Daphnia magna TaxID=35525 RepID=A0ABR0A262_9CRUS|nr:hypothetical protein OUZ56_001269 [Daphnia magna]